MKGSPTGASKAAPTNIIWDRKFSSSIFLAPRNCYSNFCRSASYLRAAYFRDYCSVVYLRVAFSKVPKLYCLHIPTYAYMPFLQSIFLISIKVFSQRSLGFVRCLVTVDTLVDSPVATSSVHLVQRRPTIVYDDLDAYAECRSISQRLAFNTGKLTERYPPT